MDGHVDPVVFRPEVPGVTEVFHTRMRRHAYPMHAHADWTLLILDAGNVRYELGRHEHRPARGAVTLLPPGIPHNGTPATEDGLRKRVVYLAPDVFDAALVGRAEAGPVFDDPVLRNRIHRLHRTFALTGEEFHAESRLALITDQLRLRLSGAGGRPAPPEAPDTAGRLRDLLDAHVADGISLEEAAALLDRHPAHLVRVFGRRFGVPPHRYLVGRRVDLARRLISEGAPPGTAAAESGFTDQAHLHRHFARILGIAPGAYARARTPVTGASGPP